MPGMKLLFRLAALLLGMSAAAVPARAQQAADSYLIDATARPAPPETTFLQLGTTTSPTGHTIAANSRYLLRDGKPWLPVMGEFHFSRYPESEWETELLKMKAGGVSVVASYVIWIHHEEVKGQFDWSGQRNLRHFVELAAKHGLYVYPRIGPWSHAEVRNGGFPDWLVGEVGSALRSNDSGYLAHVDRFYGEIARELRGLLWKDGGPVIGIQLENEYNQRGAQRGAAHIIALKRLAQKHGLDVPLYTVTGWDNAVIPASEVIPVFGGYPDMPWDQSRDELPPREVYRFRFENRWAGDLPARTAAGELHGTAQAALARYPFLGAEYGGGIQITYHRRPVISGDDVAAMLPVQIGSGVNLYGYYMFHGGTNPEGKLTTLQESQRTGYPTDVPVKSYDFQAPLSEFGEVRASYGKAKLMHYFLNEFGDQLAPMVVHAPDRVPASVADTSVLRLSARTLGERGFIFGNNYIRNYRMPDRRDVQIILRLPGETLRVPEQPIDVPGGTYFVWPVNLDMDGALLKYSTAQLVTRIRTDSVSTWFFFTPEGIAPEFAFDAKTVVALDARERPGLVTRSGGRVYVRFANGAGSIDVRTRTGERVHIELLSAAQAENVWQVRLGGADRIIVTPHDVHSDGANLHVRSALPALSFSLFPAPRRALVAAVPLTARPAGLFTSYTAAIPLPQMSVRFEQTRAADPIGAVPLFNAVSWRKAEIALAPTDSAFEHAARYRIAVSAAALERAGNVMLEIRYVGDVARLYSGDELLNDNFYNGQPWRISARRYADAIRRGALELRILPLRGDAPIYLPEGMLGFPGQRAELLGVRAVPLLDYVIGLR